MTFRKEEVDIFSLFSVLWSFLSERRKVQLFDLLNTYLLEIQRETGILSCQTTIIIISRCWLLVRCEKIGSESCMRSTNWTRKFGSWPRLRQTALTLTKSPVTPMLLLDHTPKLVLMCQKDQIKVKLSACIVGLIVQLDKDMFKVFMGLQNSFSDVYHLGWIICMCN